MDKKKDIASPTYRIIMGTISLLSGIGVGITSGFDFYNPESGVVWALITLGAALIGIGLTKEFKHRPHRPNTDSL